ncbi:MAG: hypothetical protein QNK03_07725 [Myxococcota bacterium]|nr:hypothetical protein [Myxococcota bacterium]
MRSLRSCLLVFALALTLFPDLAAAARAAWNGERAAALAAQLQEQAQGMLDAVRAAEQKARAALLNPEREPDVGVRTVVIQDLSHLKQRAKTFQTAVEAGQGREETRSLYGRIESLTRLTSTAMRNLPDSGAYRDGFGALEQTVKALGRFYTEVIEVDTPLDPQEQLDPSLRR